MKSIIHKIKPILIFLAPSLLIGSLLGLYPGYRLYQYAWYDERFCLTCHVHDYANVGWSQSIHGQTTTCHDCHHQKLRDYMREAAVMVIRQPKFPQDLHHTPYVNNQLCSACHISNATEQSTITGPMSLEDVLLIPKVDQSYLHKVHLSKTTDLTLLNARAHNENERILEKLQPSKEFSKEKGPSRQITCADCHGGPANRGHNFSAVDSSCVRCHETPHQTKITKEFGCRSCHFQSFMIPFENVEKNKLREKTIIQNFIQENKTQ